MAGNGVNGDDGDTRFPGFDEPEREIVAETDDGGYTLRDRTRRGGRQYSLATREERLVVLVCELGDWRAVEPPESRV